MENVREQVRTKREQANKFRNAPIPKKKYPTGKKKEVDPRYFNTSERDNWLV